MFAKINGKMIPSKKQLWAVRRQKLNEWCADRRLRLDEYQFWPQEMKDAEAAAFAQFDAEYEAAKAELREQLLSLTHAELTEYFEQIGWDGLSDSYTKAERVDHYLENA